MKADLHVHSTASDGTLTPTQLVDRAHANGVSVLALSDHDSVNGIAEARVAARRAGMTLIEAVELSAASDGRDVHVLAYFVDPSSQDLRTLLGNLRSDRHSRAEAMVSALNEAGYRISFDDVLSAAAGGSIGRSHIARALVEAGHAASVRQAFESLIGRDRPFYRAKQTASPEDVVAGIRRLGAIPVIAHPGVTGAHDLIAGMTSAGLLGIEAYHADHTPDQVACYAALAEELGLLTTGGSDFHGPGAPNPDIGSFALPPESVAALLAAGASL